MSSADSRMTGRYMSPGEIDAMLPESQPVRVWRTTAEVQEDRAATLARLKNARLHPEEAEIVAQVHGIDPREIGTVLPLPPDGAPAAGGPWPTELDSAAYHGVLGEIALAVAPQTEADPVAILGTLLVPHAATLGSE